MQDKVTADGHRQTIIGESWILVLMYIYEEGHNMPMLLLGGTVRNK